MSRFFKIIPHFFEKANRHTNNYHFISAIHFSDDFAVLPVEKDSDAVTLQKKAKLWDLTICQKNG